MVTKSSAILILASLFAARPARAEEPQKYVPTVVSAEGDLCGMLIKQEASQYAVPAKIKCVKAANVTLKGVGTATWYRLDAAERFSVRLVIDSGGHRLLSPPLEFMRSECGAGSCITVDRVQPALRSVTLGAVAAVALDVETRNTRSSNVDGAGKPTRWTTRLFQVCGLVKGQWSCLSTSYGAAGASCTATLSARGEITHTCTEVTQLGLP